MEGSVRVQDPIITVVPPSHLTAYDAGPGRRSTTPLDTLWEVSENQRWRLGLLTTALDPDRQLYNDGEMVIVADSIPKSRHHYLVLPLEPIDTVMDLTVEHVPLLQRMIQRAQGFADEKIRPLTHYPVVLGFHVIPTFIRLHLHIVTVDFQGPGTVVPADYRSFTNSLLFLEPERAITILEQCGRIEVDKEACKRVKTDLTSELHCILCEQPFPANKLAALKAHAAAHEADLHAAGEDARSNGQTERDGGFVCQYVMD